MAQSRTRTRTKRYLKELMHTFRYTYDDISKNTEIDADRLKAINREEEPTLEEAMIIKKFAIETTNERGEDKGE